MPETAGTSGAMAPDVFISYARENRSAAQALATALQDEGLRVWWDRQIAGGQDFAEVIAAQLAAARRVLVLWSAASVNSGFVRDEASRARDSGRLLPLRIEDVPLPLGFGSIHTLDLIDWDGDRDDPGFQALRADLRRAPDAPAGPVPTRPAAASGWRGWRRPLPLLLIVAALLGAGAWGWDFWRTQQAQAQLQQGLAAHFARDRNLQLARNAYLSALRADPELGRAHYYLGHVYALLVLPRDAREQFELALRFADDLDGAQRDDAQVQLAALRSGDSQVPVSRAPAALADGAAPARQAPAADKTAVAAPVDGQTLGLAPGAPRLPRMPPTPEQQRVIEAQVDALFAPQAQTRLQASTTLALDPALAADALPAAIERALAGLRAAPEGEAQAAGAANTLQLLLAASPATLWAVAEPALQLADAMSAMGSNQRDNAQQLRTLVGQAGAAKAPVVYLQIGDEAQGALAATLAARLRAAGYTVPAVENVGARAPTRSEVRVQGGSAPGWGRWLAKVLGELSGEPARLGSLRAARPSTDSYEIWLAKDLCVTRRVPACGA